MLRAAPGLAAALYNVTYRPVATMVAEYTSVEFPGDADGLFLPRGHATSHIAKYDEENRIRFSVRRVGGAEAPGRQALARHADR